MTAPTARRPQRYDEHSCAHEWVLLDGLGQVLLQGEVASTPTVA